MNKCANDTSRAMRRIQACSLLVIVVLIVAGAQFPQYIHRQGGTHEQNLSLACIMRPAVGDNPAAKNAPQGLGYRCAHCNSEFASRPAMDCHRRHPTSVGTPCADPTNSKSMSFTARASVSSSILRQHDTLGAAAIPTYCMFILLNRLTHHMT